LNKNQKKTRRLFLLLFLQKQRPNNAERCHAQTGLQKQMQYEIQLICKCIIYKERNTFRWLSLPQSALGGIYLCTQNHFVVIPLKKQAINI